MNTADLLGDFASGDRDNSSPLPTRDAGLKREQDSIDDFEHLDRDAQAREPELEPLRASDFADDAFRRSDPASRPSDPPAARLASQSFLDTEREELLVEPPKPVHDHLADKFTDSESEPEQSAESPRRAAPSPPQPPAPTVVQPPSIPVAQPPPIVRPATPPPAPPPAPLVSVSTPPPATPPAAPVAHPAAPVTLPAAPVAPPAAPAPPPAAPVAAPAAPPTVPPATQKAPAPAPAEAMRSPAAHVIEAEVIFCQMGLVEELIYWRSPPRSGAALGGGLALLVALACCSVVSVLAYASLLLLSATAAYRIYTGVLQAVHKTSDGHPFKWLLEAEIAVPAERAQALAAAASAHANAAAHELRRLFLVEDLVDSLKFGVLLWCLTYLGAAFNGITLLILGYVALFTLPKAYEANQAQVDANLELARAKINEITAKVRALVPLGKLQARADKDK